MILFHIPHQSRLPRIVSKGNINPAILGMICISLLVKLKIVMKTYNWMRQRGFYDQPTMNLEPVILVDDPIYNKGRISAIFRIKRKIHGNKFEIKDGNNKQGGGQFTVYSNSVMAISAQENTVSTSECLGLISWQEKHHVDNLSVSTTIIR
jgi:hypothetical protein